jgi:hypothetical protein
MKLGSCPIPQTVFVHLIIEQKRRRVHDLVVLCWLDMVILMLELSRAWDGRDSWQTLLVSEVTPSRHPLPLKDAHVRRFLWPLG